MRDRYQISSGGPRELDVCRTALGCPDLALLPASRLLVAASGDDVAGCAVFSPEFFGRMFLSRLLVVPQHRRRGVATSLVRAFEAEACAEIVFTSTNASNDAARRLFLRLGYVESGIVFNLDPGDPELIFAKRLQI